MKITRSVDTPSSLRILLYGQEGVGKTTWANAQDSLFLTCEQGSGDMDYAQVVCLTWGDLRDAVRHMIAEPPEGFRKIVIDTINGMERLCADHICRRANAQSIEDVGGGYGKGYTAVVEEMSGLRSDLDALRSKHRLHVILLGHAHVKPFNDPNGPSFDRYELRMNAKVANVWTEWADAVLFACFEATVKGGKRGKEIDDAMAKGKAVGVTRAVYTSADAAYSAKNRYNLPESLPMNWGAFAEAIKWGAREWALVGPNIYDVAAALQRRLPDATAEECGIMAERLADALKGNLRHAYQAAESGIQDAKLKERLAALRAPAAGGAE